MNPPPDVLARILAAAVPGSERGVNLPRPAGMTEKAFQADVISLARLSGWKVAHFAPARVVRDGVEKYETPVRADGKGFVDLVAIRDRVVWIECKSDTGRLTPAQQAWGVTLNSAGQEYYVFRPAMWPDIVRILTEVRG